ALLEFADRPHGPIRFQQVGLIERKKIAGHGRSLLRSVVGQAHAVAKSGAPACRRPCLAAKCMTAETFTVRKASGVSVTEIASRSLKKISRSPSRATDPAFRCGWKVTPAGIRRQSEIPIGATRP